jgi:hypothetical protein
MNNRKVINLPSKAEVFYKHVLKVLSDANLPYLIGGSLALAYYMHLPRKPKDLDIFVRKEDAEAILEELSKHGYRTEMQHAHWLAKAWQDDMFIDFIFSSGNGVAQVDDSWFKQSRKARLFGVPVRVCSPEDIVWSKAFIMDRERFDGADIAHLIRDSGAKFNWNWLLERFGDHWRLLLTHLLLFQFIYPTENIVPRWLVNELLKRVAQENEIEHELTRICQGTLLSRDQFLSDVQLYGYADGRVQPNGNMTEEEVSIYSDAVRLEQEAIRKHKLEMEHLMRDVRAEGKDDGEAA